MAADRAYVFVNLQGAQVPIGILRDRGRSFRYAASWLARSDAFPLAPDMPLASGEFVSQRLFSVFMDQCPDRWGKKLLTFLAGQSSADLDDFDFLTAMHSPWRMGALAFGRDPSGPCSFARWAYDESPVSMKDLFSFNKILRSLDVEDEEISIKIPQLKILQAMAASVTIGGARPKITIWRDNHPWIAKFARAGDIWNEPLVEFAAMKFAAFCGVNVAQCDIIDDYALLVRRFDRQGNLARHMISAFTLANLQEDVDWGSYQNLAEICRRHGAGTAGCELFKRMVYNALIGNRDDHPRNHAFYFDGQCDLTPAFDIVPMQNAGGAPCLALECGVYGRMVSRKNILSNVHAFGLNVQQARAIVEEFEEKFAAWESFFADCGVSRIDLIKLRSVIISRLP